MKLVWLLVLTCLTVSSTTNTLRRMKQREEFKDDSNTKFTVDDDDEVAGEVHMMTNKDSPRHSIDDQEDDNDAHKASGRMEIYRPLTGGDGPKRLREELEPDTIEWEPTPLAPSREMRRLEGRASDGSLGVLRQRLENGDEFQVTEDLSDQISPEPFPLVLAICLIITSAAFLLYSIPTACWKSKMLLLLGTKCWRPSRPHENGDSSIENDVSTTSENSWIVTHSANRGMHLECPMLRDGTEPNSEEIQSTPTAIETTNPKEDDTCHQVLVSWRGLNCTYHAKRKRGFHCVTAALSNVSGEMKSGELVAIMGPSGSGKTTFLDILSGRKTIGKIEGEISILGQHVTDLKSGVQVLKDVAAYIPQVVEFFPTQTPEEAVAFVANVKLGPDPRGKDIRQAHIDSLLGQIGLSSEVRTRPIGGKLAGGFVIRGLSGGERRRLALACALAMKPSMLFLDEVTSGLDSGNALVVIEILKKMCSLLHVAAAVVIHQPSIEMFDCFDRLILLSEGRSIYSGKCSQIPLFYREVLRAPMPEHHQLPADLIKQAATFNFAERSCWSRAQLAPTSGLVSRRTESNPSTFYRFGTVLQRNFLNHYVRNLTNLAARLMVHMGCTIVLGLVFWQVGKSEDGDTLPLVDASYLIGAYLFLAQGCYLVPFAQISTFFFDKQVFTKESALGLYPPWMYSLSQTILESWLLVLAALIQTSVSVPMIDLWNPAMSKLASFFTTVAIFCATDMVGNGIVLLVSTVTFSQDLSFLLGSFITVVNLATSGGFVPFARLGDHIAWLQWISPIKYSLQAFSIQSLKGTDTIKIVEMRELDRPDSVSSNLGVLLGFFTLLASCTIVSLTMQREVK